VYRTFEWRGWRARDYATVEEALRRARLGEINVALVDVGEPDVARMAGVGKLRRLAPALPAVVLATTAEGTGVLRSILEGAHGYVTQRSPPAELAAALRCAARGGAALCEEAQSALVKSLHASSSRAASLSLSPRELEVMSQLVAGRDAKEIARRFGIAAATVNGHLAHMFKKFGVHTRSEAVRSFLGI
jgi:DNA-binding NarL/FixJ family response regulator